MGEVVCLDGLVWEVEVSVVEFVGRFKRIFTNIIIDCRRLEKGVCLGIAFWRV